MRNTTREFQISKSLDSLVSDMQHQSADKPMVRSEVQLMDNGNTAEFAISKQIHYAPFGAIILEQATGTLHRFSAETTFVSLELTGFRKKGLIIAGIELLALVLLSILISLLINHRLSIYVCPVLVIAIHAWFYHVILRLEFRMQLNAFFGDEWQN